MHGHEGIDSRAGHGRARDEVEVDGLRIGYVRAGSGPPVVLVHGFAGDALSTWSRQIEALSGKYTVVAWDVPGAGRSAVPATSFRLPDYADCLAAVIRTLGLARPHVVGLSFGGALLLDLCGRRLLPARSLVVAGGYAGWAGSLPADEADQRLRACLAASELPGDEFAAVMLPSMFSTSAGTNADRDAMTAFASSVRAVNPAGFRMMARASAGADLRRLLPTIDIPTLLLWGDQDARAPLPIAHALHAAIAGSRLVVLPGVGHVSPVQAPDQFSQELLAFLQAADDR